MPTTMVSTSRQFPLQQIQEEKSEQEESIIGGKPLRTNMRQFMEFNVGDDDLTTGSSSRAARLQKRVAGMQKYNKRHDNERNSTVY